MNIHKHTVTYAGGAVMVAIMLSVTLHLMGQVMSPLNYLSYLAYIAFVVIGLKDWRKKAYDDSLTYGKAMGYSTWMAVYYSVIIAVWTYVFMAYIAPDEVTKFQNHQLAESSEMMRKYKLSETQIEQQLKLTKKFMTPGITAGFSVLGNLFFLTIINLIVSAVMKKEKQPNIDHSFAEQN